MSADQPPTGEAAATAPPPADDAARLRRRLEASARLKRFLGGTDLLLAGLLATLAFLLGSFVVRNSDFWMHLAVGRLAARGEYALGSDPLRYTTPPGEVWVNHSWLYDLATYLTASAAGGPEGAGGSLLVFLKALLVAAGAALVLAARKPGQPLWPGVLIGTIALLAAAPRLLLQPAALSCLFLASTVLLLLRRPARPVWLAPALFAGLMLLWVNCDAWFFLGPLAALLFLAGEAVEGLFARPQSSVVGPAPEPPTSSAWKPVLILLVAGVVASLFNPFTVRAWWPPPELFPGAELAPLRNDQQFEANFVATASPKYWTDQRLGANVNGGAYLALLVIGPLAFLLNGRTVRFAHLTLWFGFAGLSLVHYRIVPFFAVVAAPLTAWNLAAGLSALRKPPAVGEPDLRANGFLAFALLFGRVLTAVGLGLLLWAAWGGRLHPPTPEPQDSRAVCWAVYVDPSWVDAGKALRGWREKGDLPADAKGFNYNPDLAFHLAWFAPGERSFFDMRLSLPRGAADYVRLRKALIQLGKNDATPDHAEAVARLLRAAGVSYVTISGPPRNMLTPVFGMWRNGGRPGEQPSGAAPVDDWRLWYLDGRTVVFGFHDAQNPAEAARADALRLDLTTAAFGPQPAPPRPGPIPPFPAEVPVPSLWESLIRPPAPTPLGAHRAVYLSAFLEYERQLGAARGHNAGLLSLPTQYLTATDPWSQTPLPVTLVLAAQAVDAARTQAATDEPLSRALSLLMLRAARDAIREDPTDAEGYRALAVATSSSLSAEPHRQFARVAGLRACVDFSPADPDPRSAAADALLQSLELLTNEYQQANLLDLAVETNRRFLELSAPPTGLSPQDAARYQQLLQERVKALKEMESALKTRRDEWVLRTDSRGGAKPIDKAVTAIEAGLAREALKILQTEAASDGYARLQLASLLLRAGEVRGALNACGQASPEQPPQFAQLRTEALWVVGDTAGALASLGDQAALIPPGRNEDGKPALPEAMKAAAVLAGGLVSAGTTEETFPRLTVAPISALGLDTYARNAAAAGPEAWQQANLRTLRGLVLLEDGRNAEAAEEFRRSLAVPEVAPTGRITPEAAFVFRTSLERRLVARRFLELLKP